jgi:uncharacterized protein with PQ loop repeat
MVLAYLSSLDIVEWSGLLAGLLGMVAYIPQIQSVQSNHNSNGLCESTYLLLILSSLLWAWYGLKKKDIPIAIFSTVGGLSLVWILWKVRKNNKLNKKLNAA